MQATYVISKERDRRPRDKATYHEVTRSQNSHCAGLLVLVTCICIQQLSGHISLAIHCFTQAFHGFLIPS